MSNKPNIPELLCPAGSPEAFSAAIEGGADAIYVGGTAFNARINAKNFTTEQLREAIKLAHSYGVKVYVAANTLIYDRELPDMLRAAEDAYLCGADALIVADLGAAKLIRERMPIPLHASTQVSGHSADAAKRLAELGFSRMVCAREMSRDDLREFVKNSPLEAEVFVHGALCVCHSGQCLFSSLVGGRSGNRGECAQPCRLPFKNSKGNGYPLSLKDLSLAAYVPELCRMGIASFKIEGRMKSPEYVRDVARIWRRLIDENRGADKKEMADLAEIFSRGGFTDGYYLKNISSKMLGVRSETDKKNSRTLIPFEKITRKPPLSLSARLTLGEPMMLTADNGKRCVTVSGAIPEEAHTAPLTEDAVRKNLSRLGNTPFELKELNVSVGENIIAPLSAINALRRSAIDAILHEELPLNEQLYEPLTKVKSTVQKPRAKGNTAIFYFPEIIPKEAYDFFDTLYVPLEKYNGETTGVALPPVIFDSERETIKNLLKKARALGATDALVGNLGHISLATEAGLTVRGDLRLNITNSETAAELDRHGFFDLILSPELTLAQMRDIIRACPTARTVLYGRAPLMITEKCVGKEIGDCQSCEDGKGFLVDRRGVRFPVLRCFEHRSIIVNSIPHYMADRQAELERFGISAGHFIFTTESREEIKKVIAAYKNFSPADFDVRRIK